MNASHLISRAVLQGENPSIAQVFKTRDSSVFLEDGSRLSRIETYTLDSINGASESVSTSNSDECITARHICDHTIDEAERSEAIKLLILRTPGEIDQYVRSTAKIRIYYICQQHSYSSLLVTRQLFHHLTEGQQVNPQFQEYLVYLGEKEQELEISPPRCRFRRLNLMHDNGIRTGYECMYGLRFVERNGRNGLEQPSQQWSLRQSAVYQKFAPDQDGTSWILVSVSKVARLRLDTYISQSIHSESSSPLDVHVLLLDTIISNWRPYLVDLAAEIYSHNARILGTSPDDKGPISISDCDQRKALMVLDETLANALLSISATSDIVATLLASIQTQQATPPSIAPADVVEQFLREKLQDLDLFCNQIQQQRLKICTLTALLSSFLDLGSGFALQNLAKESAQENEEMRKLSEKMHQLTEKSVQDAVAVKVLTILTLIYLPATVVSNFFSTSFVGSEAGSGEQTHLVVHSDWWIFVAASFPLTLLTLYIWWVWTRIQAYQKYPWWMNVVKRYNFKSADIAMRSRVLSEKV